MRRMDFDRLKTRLTRPDRGGGELLDNHRQLVRGQFLRRSISVAEGECGGTPGGPASVLDAQAALWLPACADAAFTPGMGQLDAGHRSLCTNEVGNARQGVDVRIAPQTQIVGRNPAFRCHGRRFQIDQRETADGARAVVQPVPVGRQAIRGRVLAHGGHGDPVRQDDVTQLQWSKQVGHDVGT